MRRRSTLTLGLLTLLVVACGGVEPAATTPGPGVTTTAPSSADPDTTAAQPIPPTGGGGGIGHIEVDGVRYGLTEVVQCLELEVELDLMATGPGITVFVLIEDFEGVVFHELSIQGDLGIYASTGVNFGDGFIDDFDNALPGPPFEVDGDRVRGELTLYVLAGTDTVDASFDLPIPAPTGEC